MVAPATIDNPPSSSILIQSGGVDVASRGILNFIGATVVDDPGNDRVNITVTGGGTLDAAYDFGGPGAGRIILVDSGPVELTGSGATIGGFTVNGTRTIVGAAGSVWNEVLIDADINISGATGPSPATGFNMVTLNQPTITDVGAIPSMSNAATLYVGGQPVGVNMTINNAYAIWVDAGVSRFDGTVEMSVGGTIASGSSLSVAGDATTRILFRGAATSRALEFNTTAMTSGVQNHFRFTAGLDTNITAGSELIDFQMDFTGAMQHATGALTTQRTVVIMPRTYSFVGASTITNAASFMIEGSPTVGTNATITNNLAFWIGAAGNGDWNTYFGATPSMGGGVGVIGLSNATTVPTANPVGGGLLYAEAGAGKWRGSGGTITTFGPAEPHCEVCGSDYGHEWVNPKWGRLQFCVNCLTADIQARNGGVLPAWIRRQQVAA